MNPDLYGAWLTAGNRLQPAGAWLAGNWGWLVPAVAAAAFASWFIRRAVRKVDQILAEELPEPGTDSDLLLDCIAIYGDSNDLNRLRDAINQHRKEKPL